MSSIDEIKARIDIVDLASEAGVKLRRSGRTYTGFCPFHSNTRTPAFVIWPESGTWRCFGECNEGGDIFKFVMKREGLDFKEALNRLAEKAGVQLEQYSPQQQEQQEENIRLRNLLEDTVTFYRNALFNSPSGKPALEYLIEKRKLTQSTLEAFGLGYAPQGWDNALKYLTSKGYTEQDMNDAGLLSERESGGYYDRFRNRIMIPIRDENGRMAGFGARILDPNDQPKFLNSPQTAVFDKGRLLYGLDRARKPIRAVDQAVIVEGYLDVIALHQAGYENAVSPMGTALTEDQMRLLKRFTRKIVLALDPDAAGQKAVLRGLDAARLALDRGEELAFDARGLLRHEARLQADLRVASLPEGLDPDEIVERDRDEWGRIIQQARPIVEHVLETLISEQNINDPKVKTSIVAQVIPLIEDLPSPVERDSYRQMLARRLKVDERTLIGRQAGGSQPRRFPRQAQAEPVKKESAPAAVSAPSSRKTEAAILALLLRRFDLFSQLDRHLQEAGLKELMPDDFEYTDYQLLLRLLRQAQEQDEADALQFLRARADEALMGVLESLLKEPPPKGTNDRLLDELVRLVLQMRDQSLTASVNQLRFMMEDAQQAGDAIDATYQQLVLQHAKLRHNMDKARRKLSEYRRE